MVFDNLKKFFSIGQGDDIIQSYNLINDLKFFLNLLPFCTKKICTLLPLKKNNTNRSIQIISQDKQYWGKSIDL